MSTLLRPIYLFADSQLLFWEENGTLFLESVRLQVKQGGPKAAYIGAANGDEPGFYSIFEEAMSTVDIDDCRMVRTIDASLSNQDRAFLDEADIIFLASGDVERGWRILEKTKLNETLPRRYSEGAVLIGASAGAVQLGLYGCAQRAPSFSEIFETLKVVPFLIETQDERAEWARLRQTVGLLNTDIKGVGIPTGGGAIFHPNQTLEPIRHPLHEFSVAGGGIKSTMSLPPLA